MEINKWKNILTDWIIHTGFLQPSFSVLEDSNLEAFFRAYRLKFQSTITEDNVYAFLKHRFPKFAFHHFDDDGLCSAEFVFVYSLLLHYGCVQCRDVQIQNACKSLGEYQQAAVASFFKQFAGVKYEGVVRGSLRKMIVDAMRTDDQAGVALSTPKKRLSGSPDTPKNLRLEQNMRDLNKIRVQLETERYEKGFLEIQMKEGQDQITRLNAQQKVHINEIHELRNQLLYENDENRTPNLNDDKDKQMSEANGMRRNIGQLEDKVANLLVETHCLEADKGTLSKKLKHSEEQIQLLFERSEEMATLIDQLQGEVNEKSRSIADLQETNEQLHMMLNEYRSSGNPLDLNSTSDFSFSKHSEADSETSGMNLAKSVVDIQLKEKQLENEKLVEQLQQVEESKRAMEAEIEEFLNNNDLRVDSAAASSPEDRTEGLLDGLLKHFSMAINDMDQMRVKMDDQVDGLRVQKESLDVELLKLEDVISEKTNTIEKMTKDIEDAEKRVEETRNDLLAELEDLRSNCNSLQTDNDTLSVENRSYQTTIQTLEEDVFIKVNELRELNTVNERHKDKYAKLKYQHENSNRAVAEMNLELAAQRKELDTLSGDYETLRERHESVQQQLTETESALKANVKSLEDEIEEKRNSINELESAMKQLRENNSIIEEVTTCLNEEVQLKTREIRNLETLIEESKANLQSLQVKLDEKSIECSKGHDEIAAQKKTIEEIVERTVELTTENEKTGRMLQAETEKLVKLAEEKVELMETCTALKETISDVNNEVASMKKLQEELAQENVELTAQKEKSEEKVQQLQEENVKLTENKSDIEKTCIALQETISEKTAAINSLTSDRIGFFEDLQEMKRELTKSQEERDGLQSDVALKDESIEEVKKSLQALDETKSSEILDLQKKLEQLKEEKDELQIKYHQVNEEIKESIIMIHDYDEKLKFASDEMEAMHSLETELKHSLEERDKTIQDLNTNLEEVKLTMNNLESVLKESQEDGVEMTRKLDTLTEELSEQTQQRIALEQTIAGMNEDILNKSMNISSLETEVLNIKDTIVELGNTITALNEDVQEKSAIIEQRDETIVELHGKVGELGEQLETLEKDRSAVVKKLEDEKEELESKLDEMEVNNKDITQQLQSEQTTNETLKKRCDHLMELSQEDGQRIVQLQAEAVDLQEKLKSWEEVLADKETILVEVQDRLEKVQLINSKLLEEVAEKSEVTTHQEVEIGELRTLTEEMDKNISELHETLIEKSSIIVGLETKVEELRTEIESLEKTAAEEIAARNVKECELVGQIANFEEQLKSISEERNILQQTITQLNENLISGEGQVELMKNQLEALNNQLVSAKADKESFAAEKEKLTVDLETVKRNHSERTAEVSQLQANVATLEEEISQMKKTFIEIRAMEEDLKREIEAKDKCFLEVKVQFEEKLTETMTQLRRVEGKVENCDQKMVEWNNTLAQKEDTINMKTEELQQLQITYEEKVAEIDQLKERITTARVESDKLKDELSNKDVQLLESASELSRVKEEFQEQSKVKCELTEKLQVLSMEKEQIVSHCEQLKSDLEMLKTDSNTKEFNLQLELTQLKEEFQEQERAKTELSEQLQELTTVKQQIISRCEQLENDVQVLTKNSNSTEFNLQSELSQVKEELKEQLNAKADLSVQLQILSTEKEQIVSHCEQLKSDLEVLKTDSNTKEFHLQSELDKLNEERKNLHETMTSLNDEAVIREQRIATLTEQVEEVKQQLAVKEESLEMLVDESEKRKMLLAALEQEKVALQEEKNTLTGLINKLTTENKVVELQLDECEKKLAEINEEYETVKSRHTEQVDQLQKDLEEVRAERKTLSEVNRQHEMRMVELNAEVVEKERKVSLLMTDLHKNELGQMEESSKINMLLTKIESYKTDEVKLQELENLHHREKEINQKLTTDVEILFAKLAKNRKETEEKEKVWRDERKELQQTADDRMKDYRLEMEGKLEKMKDKMKTLYNDEMGKLKNKHERDFLEVRKEIVSKQHQIEEYDVQCRKLAKQIRQLNERQLDMYKENEFMKTRLKVHDAAGGIMQRSLSHRMLPPSSSMLSVANLKMEDEEGEVFNNTYLIDLKNGGPMMASGRTSPSRESICLSELQHRNSLVPRHLRSTYTVQYGDQGYREEDLQTNGGGLDDSMSSLLNTGQRKKVGGTTSYKRPGPPTPSKNGGRLSFGGTGGSVVGRLSLGGTGYDSLNPREVLKEFNDNASNRKSISKDTPGKVLGGLFSSNSSKVRNENATPKKRLSIFRNKK